MTQHTAVDIALGREVVGLAQENVARGERPFAALIARGGQALARAVNLAVSTCDPTDHAELRAIRDLTSSSNSEQLTGLTLYASCEPCVMCASAIRWANLDRVVFCLKRETASRYGFADVVDPDLSRAILTPSRAIHLEELNIDATVPFEMWSKLND